MLDFITETNNVWQNMRSCGKPLVLYGMGNGADAILDRMAEEGLTAAALFASDEFVRGQNFRGFTVEHYVDIKARLGDFAESIARSVMNLPDDTVISENIILASRLEEMCQLVFDMLALAREAIEKEDVDLAQQVIAKDNGVDEINKQALTVVAAYLEKHPKEAYLCLLLIAIIRKLERFGDHCTNIAEETIFYLEAKVVKHSEKKYEA